VEAKVARVVKEAREDIMEALPVATMKVVVSVSIGVKVCTEEMTSSTMMVRASTEDTTEVAMVVKEAMEAMARA